MGTSLTGKQIKNTYKSLIKTSDSTEASATAKLLSDGNGNDFGVYIDTDGVFGIGSAPSYSLDVSSRTDGVALPVGTTANRPTPTNGLLRYNSTIGKIEFYDGGWKTVFTTSGGTIDGSLTVTGDLTIQGTTVTLNTETVQFEDNILLLNRASADTQYDAVNAGIEIEKTGTNPSFLYTYSTSTWGLTDNLTIEGDLTVDTNTLYVDSADNRVGIGTLDPQVNLQVEGTIMNYRSRYSTNQGTSYWDIRRDSSTGNFVISDDGLGDVIEISQTNGNVAFDTNTLYVDSTNNRVGIGTVSPNAVLEVEDGGTSQNVILKITADDQNLVGLVVGNDTATGGTTDTNGLRQFVLNSGVAEIQNRYNGASGILALNSNGGNVGIGTDSPARIFTVSRDNTSSISASFVSANNQSAITLSGSATTSDTQVRLAAEGNDMLMYAGNSERLRIDSSGNVGIGGSPSYKLDVFGSGRFSSTLYIADNTAVNFGLISQIYHNSSNAATHFTGTYGTDTVVIKDGGNVGIGTTSPSVKFHVVGTDTLVGAFVSNNSTRTELAIDNTSTNNVRLGLKATSSGAIIDSTNHAGSNIQPLLFQMSGSEKMRITSGGDVLIGTTGEPNGTSVYGSAFTSETVNRMALRMASSSTAAQNLVFFYNPNGQVGRITTDGSATSYVTSSDYRLKENVVPMEGALDRVDALKPSRFNFIADADKTVDGFLAHEVAEVVPEAISGEKDAVDEEGNAIYQGIDQSKLVPLLVGAIQELRAEIETLKSQINP